MHHPRQDSTWYGLCYISCGALVGTRNSSRGHIYLNAGIAPWEDALPWTYILLPGLFMGENWGLVHVVIHNLRNLLIHPTRYNTTTCWAPTWCYKEILLNTHMCVYARTHHPHTHTPTHHTHTHHPHPPTHTPHTTHTHTHTHTHTTHPHIYSHTSNLFSVFLSWFYP